MNDTQFNEFDRKLGLLIKLSAMNMIHDMEYRQQIELLNRIGLQPKEISKIVGKSANNVNVTLHLINKKKKGGQKDEQSGST